MKNITEDFKTYREKGSDTVLANLYDAKKEIEEKIHIFNVLSAISALKDMIGEFKSNEVHSMCLMHGKMSNGEPSIDLIFKNKDSKEYYEHDENLDPLREKVTSILMKIDRNLSFFNPLYLECSREYSFKIDNKGLDNLQEAFLNEKLSALVLDALASENLVETNDKKPLKKKI